MSVRRSTGFPAPVTETCNAAVPTIAPPSTSGSSASWSSSSPDRRPQPTLGHLGETESRTFTAQSGGDADVARLQVAMRDSLLMRRLESGGNLPRDGERFIHRQRASPLETLGQRFASISSITR
jgi:hypothetical protein